MEAVSAIEVVHALDVGVSELHQVTALLRAAGHEPDTMPIGVGDRVLVELVDRVTGAPIEFTVACPSCGAVNEIALGVAELTPHEPCSRWFGPGCGLREATYGDLDGLPRDVGAAAAAIARRCAIGPVDDLADDDLADAVDEVDRSLSGPVDLPCVACGDGIRVVVDAEHLALERLRDVAARADLEVHLLAARYGWDLATIEAMPDLRRARLARMVEQAS